LTTSLNIQNIVDQVRIIPTLAPIFSTSTGGYSLEPALTIANETLAYMFGTAFPWKFNQIAVTPFYSNSYQQDYAVPGVTNIAWLQSGDCVNINNNAIPKYRPQVEIVRTLPRFCTSPIAGPWFGIQKFQVCWLPNSQLYFGTWGAATTGNATTGNNPVAHSVYTSPLGNNISQPVNPITQIQDANGNYLVLTTYGTEGTTAPVAAVGAAAGTTCSGSGASTVWTVVDPNGQGFRIGPVPGQTGIEWQFNLYAQAKPPAIFTKLSTLISPIPDEYAHIFRQGFISIAYRYSPEDKVRALFTQEMQLWQAALMAARMQSDREPESFSFVPVSGIVAPVYGGGQINPGNPFGGYSS